MHKYTKTISNPWFDLIKNRTKKIEGRLNVGSFSKLQKNDMVEWINQGRKVLTLVRRVTKYPNFQVYLENEGLRNTLPIDSVKSIEDGYQVYNKYFTKESEQKFGVLAIEVIVLD